MLAARHDDDDDDNICPKVNVNGATAVGILFFSMDALQYFSQ